MSFRIPERRTPKRLTLAETLNHILEGTFRKTAENDLAAALYYATVRIAAHQFSPTPSSEDLPPAPDFALDPIDIAEAILDGIKAGALSVEGVPELYLAGWQSDPRGIDWASGMVRFGGPGFTYDTRMVYPTLSLDEAVALFSGADKPSKTDRPSDSADQNDARPVSLKAIQDFLDRHADGRRKESELRDLAKHTFAPKPVRAALWREAFSLLPEDKKRARGEHDSTLALKSGA